MRENAGLSPINMLIILDYDETLVHTDGSQEDFTIIKQLHDEGIEFCIASRNDKYHLENQLTNHSIIDFFTYIMADFRPKFIQIKHILWLYEKNGLSFDDTIFIDDHRPNLERVRQELPNIHCIHFGSEIYSLNELESILHNLN
jgi:predicted enzyme involved in methoxymalonyl-ACP biosynthesis